MKKNIFIEIVYNVPGKKKDSYTYNYTNILVF